MAATHLSRYFQDAELVQIIDPRIPTIGVGEGTTPGFHLWLDEITGVPFEDLRRDLRVTKKRGVRFENWGQRGKAFDHAFVPANAMGLHLSATKLVVFLRRYVRGDIIDAHVSDIHGSDDTFPAPFDGMTPLGFAQVGMGIGDSHFDGVAA